MYIDFMIRLKLNEMLENRGMSAYALHIKSDKELHQSVISKIKNNDSKALQLDTLDMLCKLLDCQPADLMIYESTTQSASTTQNVARATQSAKHTQSVNTTQSASDNVNRFSFADAMSELKQIGKPKSDSSLRRYLQSEKLKGELVGGEWQIEKSDFVDFVNSKFFKSLK
jgi:putative transcriptional regulator